MAFTQRPYAPRHPSPLRDEDPFDGVLILDKPAGPTSHDVVDRVRRQFRLDKVGHGGTLDPQATGLLLLLLGRATKLSERFLSSDKTYEGTLRLGVTTDSQDAQGKVLREADWSAVTREQLEAQLAARRGDQLQTPPMVSAVKVEGVPLYKHARKGREIERKARMIHVYAFDLLTFEPPLARFRVRCTKGTYVRTLCADIGEALGCGACLAELRRTQSGAVTIDEAVPVARILELPGPDALIPFVQPLRRFLALPGDARAPAGRSD